MYLDLDEPSDELKYLFLKHHKRVKNSILEHKAGANFVLINKDEEAKKSNMYNKVKRKASSAFDKLTTEDIKKALRLFGHNADSMSPEVAENKLYDIVEGNPQGFLDRWVNNSVRDTEVLLERTISMNVIRKNKNLYKYGSDVIARSKEEAIDYLDSPKNQDVRIIILKQVDVKGSSLIADDIKKEPKVKKEMVIEKTPKPAKKGDTI